MYRIATDRILDAATTVFAREGFDRANMDMIAAEADATKPTLYARFGSKEGLYKAAVEREYALRKQRLFQAYGGGTERPFRRRLHDWSRAYFDLAAERPDAFVLISEGERHPAAATIIRRAHDEIVDRIAQLVAETSGTDWGQGGRLLAAMISAIFTACAREALVAGRIDIERAAALCESFLYAALRGLDRELFQSAR